MLKRAFGVIGVSSVCLFGCAQVEDASADAPEATADDLALSASLPGYGNARWASRVLNPTVSGSTLTGNIEMIYNPCTMGLCDELGDPNYTAYGGGVIVRDLGQPCTEDVAGTPYTYCLSTSQGRRYHRAAATPTRGLVFDSQVGYYNYNVIATGACGNYRTLAVHSYSSTGCADASTLQNPSICAREVSNSVYYCQ